MEQRLNSSNHFAYSTFLKVQSLKSVSRELTRRRQTPAGEFSHGGGVCRDEDKSSGKYDSGTVSPLCETERGVGSDQPCGTRLGNMDTSSW